MYVRMYCNNCGKKGHLYKECKLPIISCGNIIFRLDKAEPEILMIQRKDSLCYIDFIRGKYDIKNHKYQQILIDKCSKGEKDNLINKSFKELWQSLWLIEGTINENEEYLKLYNKFRSLKEGIHQKDKVISIEYLVANSKTCYEMSEWEFPKGRRNSNENDYDCAKREFKEETSYLDDDYDIISNLCPFTEEFCGENRVRYKYIYYIGQLTNNDKIPLIDPENKEQITEIKTIRWFTVSNALNIVRDYHHSRVSIINKVNNLFEMIENDKYSLIS